MDTLAGLQKRQKQLNSLIAKFAGVKSLVRKWAFELTVIEGQIEMTETTEKSIQDQVKQLEGKKATLMIVNTMGFPVSRQVKVQRASIVSAKRYESDMTTKECLELQYVEKGKRKPVAYRFTEADLAIAEGWQDIKEPSEFAIFDYGLLEFMTSQAKNVAYTQQGLLR